jgi:hypothetical protein
MILTGSQPTGRERCGLCRILHDPICYAQKTEVAHLASSERSTYYMILTNKATVELDPSLDPVRMI